MYLPTTKTDFYDNFDNSTECPKENLIETIDLDDNLNFDLNYFEDQLENFIMLENFNTMNQQQPQPIIINRQNSIANILNSMEVKTSDINAAEQFPNFFRGLSTLELDTNTPEICEKNLKQHEDITDMLIQNQSESENFTTPGAKTFDTLSTVKLDMTMNNQVNKENDYNLQPGLISSSVSQRTSTDSNTSSLVVKKKRGRRPTSMLDASNKQPNRVPTKRERIIKEAQCSGNVVVCFGNKVVKKDTDEYKKRRSCNNEAVKKCRQRNMEQQREKEERMKTLDDENKRLNNKVDSLMKELSVLKNIVIQMSPHKRLPEHLEKMIKAEDES